MRRNWFDRFFRGDDEYEEEYEEDEAERPSRVERPSRPASAPLEPPILSSQPPPAESLTPAPSAPLDLPPAPQAAPQAIAPQAAPQAIAPEPSPAPEPPSVVRAVGAWAGGEVAGLLHELPPAARERAAEALQVWHETELMLAQSLKRSRAIADQTAQAIASTLADPAFEADAARLRQGTEGQAAALEALLAGNRARTRDWVLSAVYGQRAWPPAKVIRLFDLVGVGPLTLDDLQTRLRSMDAGPRAWVAEALGALPGQDASQALMTLLRDPDAGVRATAVDALGRRGDATLLHALSGVIKRDPDWLVRLRAIQAAQSVEGYEAIGFLHDLLRDAGWWRELQVLDSVDRAPGGGASNSYEKVGNVVVNSLLAKVQAALAGADPSLRGWMMEVLGDSSDVRAVPLLSSALHDADLEVRTRALRGLGRIGGPTIVDLIMPALKDQQPQVRIQAIEALGDANDFRAMEPLLEAMRDSDEYVRAAAAVAVGKIWDRRALGPMMDALSALNDPDKETRDQFLRAMQKMSDPRTMNLLNSMMEAGGMRRRPGA